MTFEMNLSLKKLATQSITASAIQLIAFFIVLILASCKGCDSLEIKPGLNFLIEKESLLGEETAIKLVFYHTENLSLSLENYKLIARIQETKGSDSTLEYIDAQGNKQSKVTIDEPLTHFFKEKTLVSGKNSMVSLPLNINPGIDVTDLIIHFELYDIDYANIVETRLVRWIDVATNFTIKNIEIANLNHFSGDQPTEFQLKNKEVNSIRPSDLTVTLESSNAAKFEFINSKGELAGTTSMLKDLFGNNKTIQPDGFTAPIQFKLVDSQSQSSANITITIKQGDTVIGTQQVIWSKKAIQLGLVVENYVLGSKQVTYKITNKGTEAISDTDQVTLAYHNDQSSNKATLASSSSAIIKAIIKIDYIAPNGELFASLMLDLDQEESATFTFELLYDKTSVAKASVTCQEDVQLILDINYDPSDPQQLVHYEITNKGTDQANQVSLRYKTANTYATIANHSTGHIDHLDIPASGHATTGKLTGNLGKLDFNGTQSTSFDFILSYRGKRTEITKVFAPKNLDLILEDLKYDPSTQKLTYTVTNKGTDAVAEQDKITLRYKNKAASNTATLQPNGKTPAPLDTLLLKSIAAKGQMTDFLSLDLKNNLNAEFEFALYSDEKQVGAPKPVNFNIQLEITEPVLNQATNEVTFKVHNKGNVPTTKDIFLTYDNKDHSNRAQFTDLKGKVITNNQIPNSIPAGNYSDEQKLNLKFSGEKEATFNFKINYQGNFIERPAKFNKNIQLALGLTYEPLTRKITYKITNQGSEPVRGVDKIRLDYENKDNKNAATLTPSGGNATKKGTINLAHIPASGQTTDCFYIDPQGHTDAEFEFNLYYDDAQVGLTQKIIYKEHINLQLAEVTYNAVDNKIYYKINNTGKDKTAKHVFLQHTSPGGTTLNGQAKIHKIDLGQIESNQAGTGALEVDLGNELAASFKFELLYGTETVPKDVKSVDCNVQLEMTDLTFDPANNQVTFNVQNRGNVTTTKPINLLYENKDKNKAQLVDTSGITIPSLKPGEKSAKQLTLDFKGEQAANFSLKVFYANNIIERQRKFEKAIKLKLELESYIIGSNQVKYKVTNQASYPVIDLDKITLHYKNKANANQATLTPSGGVAATSGTIALKHIHARNGLIEGTLGLGLAGEIAAEFEFQLFHDGNRIATSSIICPELIKLSFVQIEYRDKKLYYQVENTGNNKITKDVYLKYRSSNDATLGGNKEGTIALNQLDKGITSGVLDLEVDLKNNLATTFTCDLVCGTDPMPKATQSLECKIVLQITELVFDRNDKQVSFKVANMGNVNTAGNIAVKYRNIDPLNKTQLVGTSAAANGELLIDPIKAGEASDKQTLGVKFKGSKSARFRLNLFYNNSKTHENTVLCNAVPKVNIEAIADHKLEGITRNFKLRFTNHSGFELNSEELKAIKLIYQAKDQRDFAQAETLKQGASLLVNDSNLFDLLKTATLPNLGHREIEVLIDPKQALKLEFELTLIGSVVKRSTKTTWELGKPYLELTCPKPIFDGAKPLILKLTNHSNFVVTKEVLKSIQIQYEATTKHKGKLIFSPNKGGTIKKVQNATLDELLSSKNSLAPNETVEIVLTAKPKANASQIQFKIWLEGVKNSAKIDLITWNLKEFERI
jgi:hypothetical protein